MRLGSLPLFALLILAALVTTIPSVPAVFAQTPTVVQSVHGACASSTCYSTPLTCHNPGSYDGVCWMVLPSAVALGDGIVVWFSIAASAVSGTPPSFSVAVSDDGDGSLSSAVYYHSAVTTVTQGIWYAESSVGGIINVTATYTGSATQTGAALASMTIYEVKDIGGGVGNTAKCDRYSGCTRVGYVVSTASTSFPSDSLLVTGATTNSSLAETPLSPTLTGWTASTSLIYPPAYPFGYPAGSAWSTSQSTPTVFSWTYSGSGWLADADYEIVGAVFLYGVPSPPSSTSVTVGTSPSDLETLIDGTAYTSTQTFTWGVGSYHKITAVTPSDGYAFSSWSNSGTRSQLYHITGTATLTASYTFLFSALAEAMCSATVNGTCGGSLTATFPSLPATAGIIVWASAWEGGGSMSMTVTDSADPGNMPVAVYDHTSYSNLQGGIWYRLDTAGGSGVTVTVDFGNSGPYEIQQVVAYAFPNLGMLQTSAQCDDYTCPSSTIMATPSTSFVGGTLQVGGALTDSGTMMAPTITGWTNSTFHDPGGDEAGSMVSLTQTSPTTFSWTDPGGVSNFVVVGAIFDLTGENVITIKTSPLDLPGSIFVNGTPYSSTISFELADGTVLNLTAMNVVLDLHFGVHDFTAWSQGGSRSQMYTVSGSAVLVAEYGSNPVPSCSNAGTNPYILLQRGCLAGTIYYQWFRILGPYAIAFMDFFPALGAYLATENTAVAVMTYVLFALVTAYLLPQTLLVVAPLIVAVLLGGTIFQALRSNKGG